MSNQSHKPLGKNRDRIFWATMSVFGIAYLGLIVAMICADFQFVNWQDIKELFGEPEIRFSIWLSLISCTISAIFSMWVAIPSGYVLARLGRDAIEQRFSQRRFPRKLLLGVRYVVDTILDIPIVLPPLVVGISLLILFQTSAGRWLDSTTGQVFSLIGFPEIDGITYQIPAVILAQFAVATAFAIRTMRDTFEQVDGRSEQVATTLGASRFQAFTQVALPQARLGCVAAFTLAWARSLGEFGPILIFAGTTRMKTEVLSTTVYLNFQLGNLRGAVAASLILLSLAILVLVVTRFVLLAGRSSRGVIV